MPSPSSTWSDALPRQLETHAGIAGFLLNAELFGLGLDYDRRLPDLIRAVTHEAAMDTARGLLQPDRATVVVAGPEAPGFVTARAVRAVFFDVDFTLIYPGPGVPGPGLPAVLRRPRRDGRCRLVRRGREGVPFIIDDVEEPVYDHELFVRYTASIIEHMGGRGPGVIHAAREIYGQWATNHHFEMYDDVEPVLRALVEQGFIVGAISNSHRSLEAFCEHFSLRGLIHATVSSFEHGYLKPHPSIFEEALSRAGAEAASSLMVGDSVKADVSGALAAGMRAVLLRRSGDMPHDAPAGVPSSGR